jgi:hypothetical protein
LRRAVGAHPQDLDRAAVLELARHRPAGDADADGLEELDVVGSLNGDGFATATANL